MKRSGESGLPESVMFMMEWLCEQYAPVHRVCQWKKGKHGSLGWKAPVEMKWQ